MYAYNETYGNYFGNGWNRTAGNIGHKYYMSDEDDFIFRFIHFTKHYRIGGIGARHVVDLWVYLRTHPELDFAYIEEIIKTLNVYNFYKNTIKLIDMWFNDGETDNKVDLMTDFIFDSGSWGTLEHSSLASGVKAAQEAGDSEKGKNRMIRNIIFPSAGDISHRYTVLEKRPYLLPLIWVRRGVEVLLFRRDNLKLQGKRMAAVSTEKISEYEKSLEYVGLNFTFEEPEEKH